MNKTRWMVACVVACSSMLAAACTTGGGGYHPPANTPPVAHIVATPSTSGTAPLAVSFDGSTSTDAEGAVIDWAWDFGELGATASGVTASHTYNTAGTFTVTLTVTDNGALTDTDTVVITVTDDPAGRYVATTGADTGTCAASATPCLTVQYAVDQANATGDTVHVASGNYPEVVYVAKDITFKGANAGISAGVSPGTRGAESAVKGIRTGVVGVTPGTVQRVVNIDGMAIDPQGDVALISATASPLVWLRGGASATSIGNNVFTGGSFVPNCSYTCTTMTDFAFTVQSGTVSFSNNLVQNFRRALNINQPVGAPATTATVAGNVLTGITSRAISLAGSTGVQMGGQTVTGNQIDAVGRTAPSSPAGITVSNAGNTISGNTFTSFASGVYVDLCKKFLTDNNSITGNTFTNNGGAINISVNTDGGQCVSSTTEGASGWVTGAGRITGLVVTGNNFSGNSSYAIRHAAFNWGFFTSVYPTSGAVTIACNWHNSASGPGATGSYAYPPGTVTLIPDGVIDTVSPQPSFTPASWLDAPAPGGTCA